MAVAPIPAARVVSVPVRPFSGWLPASGPNRLSRQVPVHSPLGSMRRFACVSL